MSISVFSIVSELHDPRAVEAVTREALSALSVEYKFMGDDFNSYGSHDLDIIMVCTGGTEGIFKRMLPMLREKSQKPFYLLASNKSNALPASMEILSFLREFGLEGEILHGQPSYISLRINQLLRVQKAVQRYELDTHYESGIGVGIRGYMQEGPVTVFKLSGDFSRFFVAEGELIRNQSEPDLCRTQQVARLSHIEDAQYFLKEPIGNHHVVVPGYVASEIAEVIRGVI